MAVLIAEKITQQVYFDCLQKLPNAEIFNSDKFRVSVKRWVIQERKISNPGAIKNEGGMSFTGVVIYENEWAIFNKVEEDGFLRWKLDSRTKVEGF